MPRSFSQHAHAGTVFIPSRTSRLILKFHDTMFDFQKLEVYQKSRRMHKKVIQFLFKCKEVPPRLRDQLSRASLSVMLLIAEGAGRFTKADKKHFYIQSRASAFEIVACLEACVDLEFLSEIEFKEFNDEYSTVSKMFFGLIR